MHAEVAEKFLILGLIVAHELFKLALDALFKALPNDFELAVMLQNLAGDV